MDASKIAEVIGKYRNYFEENSIKAKFFPTDSFPTCKEDKLSYLCWMNEKIEELLKENEIGKAGVWLGFIQGAFWDMEKFTIDESKDLNRP